MTPHVCLNSNSVRRDGITVRLPADAIELLWAMNQRPGEVLTAQDMCRALWGKATLPLSWHEVISTAVSQIRKAIEPFGGRVKSVRSVGYVLSWEDGEPIIDTAEDESKSGSAWTPERIEQFRKLLSKPGTTQSYAAARLGITKNSVAGAVTRYHLRRAAE